MDAAAASSYETPSGIFETLTSGKWICSEYAPHRGPVWKPQTCLLTQSNSRPSVHALQTLHERFE
jgi:hypothetical protein